jgi:hypothetical protein
VQARTGRYIEQESLSSQGIPCSQASLNLNLKLTFTLTVVLESSPRSGRGRRRAATGVSSARPGGACTESWATGNIGWRIGKVGCQCSYSGPSSKLVAEG